MAPRPHPRTPFLIIHTDGAVLPADLLQRIAAGDRGLDGLPPESYHPSGEKLNEAINRSWNRVLGAWAAFSTARETEHGRVAARYCSRGGGHGGRTMYNLRNAGKCRTCIHDLTSVRQPASVGLRGEILPKGRERVTGGDEVTISEMR